EGSARIEVRWNVSPRNDRLALLKRRQHPIPRAQHGDGRESGRSLHDVPSRHWLRHSAPRGTSGPALATECYAPPRSVGRNGRPLRTTTKRGRSIETPPALRANDPTKSGSFASLRMTASFADSARQPRAGHSYLQLRGQRLCLARRKVRFR